MSRQRQLIQSLTPQQLHRQVWISQGLLAAVAVILALLIRPDWSGQLHISSGLIAAGLTAGAGIAIIDLVLMRLLPFRYYDDGGFNNRLFSHLPVGSILVISLVIAIVEETLFRGVVHSAYGWLVGSVLFALVHFRYFSHWYLAVNITVLSFFIGWIYEITGSLIAVIVLHFTVDAVLGIAIRISAKTTSK